MRLGLEAGKQTLDLAVELGIVGVPVAAEQLAREGVAQTLAPLRERGLEVCQIGAFGYNPLSPDRGRQMAQQVIVEQAIPLARETGCPYIVICGGNYHPSGFGAGDARNHGDETLDEIARTLGPLLSLAEEYGAKLSIEPYLKTAIYSPARFTALYQRLESEALCVNIDVTSFYDYWDLWDPRERVRKVCSELAGHYGLGHLKEVALQEGFHIHAGLAPLGSGSTDWGQVLSQMAPHVPTDSWVVLEHVQTPEEARASVALLRCAAAGVGVALE